MSAKKKDLEAVHIDAHGVGNDKVYIEWFLVPKDLRGRGVGTAAYRQWEKGLPKTVRYVTLNAVDSGHGYSGPFWESLGFVYKWDYGYAPDVSDRLYESSHFMIKGVGRTLTPKTVSIDPDEVG
jgi:GNAT superfamily N-acetyltransferase